MCGSLPLHLATRNGCDSEILTMLFEAYPEALDKKNSLGDTPWQSLDVSTSGTNVVMIFDDVASLVSNGSNISIFPSLPLPLFASREKVNEAWPQCLMKSHPIRNIRHTTTTHHDDFLAW